MGKIDFYVKQRNNELGFHGFSALHYIFSRSEREDYFLTRDRLIDYKQYGRRVVDEVTARIHGMDLDDIENVY